MPQRHGRPNESLMTTPTRDARGRLDQALPDGRAPSASGSLGQQGDTSSAADVGGVDAGVGAHEAVSGAADDDAALHAQHLGRLAQHDLDLARVAVPAPRRSSTASGRGSTSRRSTMRPSAFETTFWVTTRTSSARGASSGRSAISARQASTASAARSSPGLTSGSVGQGDASERAWLVTPSASSATAAAARAA